jgi:hypothetical protein
LEVHWYQQISPRRVSVLPLRYRIIDPGIVSLLDQGLCLSEDLPRSVRLGSATAQGVDKRVDFVR